MATRSPAPRFVPPEKRNVGLMFQDFALFPHLTIVDNVAFGLKSLPREEARREAELLRRDREKAERAEAKEAERRRKDLEKAERDAQKDADRRERDRLRAEQDRRLRALESGAAAATVEPGAAPAGDVTDPVPPASRPKVEGAREPAEATPAETAAADPAGPAPTT